MANVVSSTEVLGARLLREVANEEGSLEMLLQDLLTAAHPNPSRTGIPSLDTLIKAHSQTTANTKLAISGRGLPLLYNIVNHLVSSLDGTVVVIDPDRRFSPSHLSCDLKHVHVFRPTRESLKVTMESVEGYMLYGDHRSKGREWVGTVINGGVGAGLGLGMGIDITVEWRGWLRVEREEVGSFGEEMSVEEAWSERGRRQEVVDGRGWRAGCEVGNFSWR